jgi:hypothetical protein
MPEIDKQIFIDRLLESENLVGDLEDAEAEWLLNWGIHQVEGLIRDIDEFETAGERINALMAVMRKANQIVADRNVKNRPALAGDLEELARRYAQAFGGSQGSAPADLEVAAGQLADLSPGEAVRYVIALVNRAGQDAGPS